MLAHVEKGEDVTLNTTVKDILSTGPVVCDGSPVLVEFFSPAILCSTAGTEIQFQLYDGATAVGRIGQLTVVNILGTTLLLRRRLGQGEFQDFTPSAGPHTFTVKGVTTTGTAVVRGGFGAHANDPAPMYVRVTSD